jgi:ubiquinone/menaquinone biosynthesis C-methylase UbiE
MNQKEAPPIGKVYDDIAESFDSKRVYPWEEVQAFIQNIQKNEWVLDLGCGNGRHIKLVHQKQASVIGLDISFKLLQIAKQNQLKMIYSTLLGLINGDMRYLPFHNDIFDRVIMIASFHHLKNIQARKRTLAEIARVMKPKSELFLSCWMRTHPRFKKEDLREQIEKGEKDVIVPWKLNNKKIPRYYYLFDQSELLSLIKGQGLQILSDNIVNHNLYVVARK